MPLFRDSFSTFGKFSEKLTFFIRPHLVYDDIKHDENRGHICFLTFAV